MYQVEVHDTTRGQWGIAYYTLLCTYEDAMLERDKVVEAIRHNNAEKYNDMVAISKIYGGKTKFLTESVVTI